MASLKRMSYERNMNEIKNNNVYYEEVSMSGWVKNGFKVFEEERNLPCLKNSKRARARENKVRGYTGDSKFCWVISLLF